MSIQALINERNERKEFERIIKQMNDMNDKMQAALNKSRSITKC